MLIKKKDLIKAIEDMPMDKVFGIIIRDTHGNTIPFGPFKSIEIIDGFIIFKESKWAE